MGGGEESMSRVYCRYRWAVCFLIHGVWRTAPGKQSSLTMDAHVESRL